MVGKKRLRIHGLVVIKRSQRNRAVILSANGPLPLTVNVAIKMKWMALVYVAIAGYDFINGNIVTRVVIGASLLNFVIFFLSSRNFKRFGPGEQARKAKFKKQSRPHMTYTNGAHHRCAVCGRTELDDPCLEFRYCSKCNGNYEYCQDHLFTHEHVK